jgi:hypothetical protein
MGAPQLTTWNEKRPYVVANVGNNFGYMVHEVLIEIN